MELSEYFPMWNKLNHSQKEQLSESSHLRNFEKGDLLYNGTADCTGLFLVRSGQLRAYTISDEGREVTLYRLFEGDICLFSASCMMRSIQFDITIQAEKDTQALIIPPDVYRSIMEESAPLSNFTNEIMAARFSEVMWLLDQIMWKSFDKRLAKFLLEEANIEGTNELHITHETIGNHLGNAREVVTRMLRYFQSEGLVKLSRGVVTICNAKALRKLRGD